MRNLYITLLVSFFSFGAQAQAGSLQDVLTSAPLCFETIGGEGNYGKYAFLANGAGTYTYVLENEVLSSYEISWSLNGASLEITLPEGHSPRVLSANIEVIHQAPVVMNFHWPLGTAEAKQCQ